GLAAGAPLSVTHGTVGRSAHPHRLFALVGMALGVFAILFLGATPPGVQALGGWLLFAVFAGVMAVAAAVSALAFPAPEAGVPRGPDLRAPLPRVVWAGIFGVSAMALVQSMIFSFLERVGADRGFGLAAVTGVLVALGVVNLSPAVLAAALERRLPAHWVLRGGPVVQGGLALVIVNAQSFAPYAAAASVFAAVMIFTHTFAFGTLARLDPSGRALAATPAMLMAGSALGPIVGGTLVQWHGYPALGWATTAVGLVALLCFARVRLPGGTPPPAQLKVA
ncbi:hypothetical protein, partial [Ideonella sp. B508-1]|uniref:hypothetical protein n=1 Tax=Ideonella sp. B508-1 TaxID=137716 RepID=UPI0003B57C18